MDEADDIIARTQELLEGVSAGPWAWHGNVDVNHVYLGTWNQKIDGKSSGLVTVMDFARWGMQGAEPRFRDENWIMHNARTMPVFEVSPNATDREDRSVYRGDIAGIRHPDAKFIAESRQLVDDLLATVVQLRAENAQLRGEADV